VFLRYFSEFYTTSPPIHESTKHDEHELRVDDVDVELEQGPSFDATEPELANFSHTRMSMSVFEEQSTASSVIYRNLPAVLTTPANQTINAFAESVQSPTERTDGFSGFRVPEDRSTVFESCHDANTTRADVTRFVDSIDGIYGGSVRDSESDSSAASLPGSASCQPSSKRRYVKATTVHSRL
jgi:hypothetical protein